MTVLKVRFRQFSLWFGPDRLVVQTKCTVGESGVSGLSHVKTKFRLDAQPAR
jgi:hypothetical protein